MQEMKSQVQPARSGAGPSSTSKSADRRVVSGHDLAPRIDPNSAAVNREFIYWVGALPGLPTEHVDLCGVNFPKVNENLLPDPGRSDRKIRVPVIGALVRLTPQKLKAIEERLRRTVVRFYEAAEIRHEPGTGENIGDVHQRPRRGQVITIPREADIEAAEKAGRAARRYTPDRRDVPIADFLFMELCSNQETGNRRDSYPEPLSATGLVYPEADAAR